MSQQPIQEDWLQETPKTSAVKPLGESLGQIREEVFQQAQANHPGLSREQFLEISEAFGF